MKQRLAKNVDKVFVADIKKIKEQIGLVPKVSAREGLESMIEWVRQM